MDTLYNNLNLYFIPIVYKNVIKNDIPTFDKIDKIKDKILSNTQLI